MEDLIGIIIAIAIGLAAKWVEGLSSGKKKDSEEAPEEPSRPAASAGGERAGSLGIIPSFRNVFQSDPAPKPQRKERGHAAPKPAYVPLSEHHKPVEAGLETPPPVESFLSEVTSDVTEPQLVDTQRPIVDPIQKARRRQALERHYDRWRRAIVDTQIIAPKFDE